MKSETQAPKTESREELLREYLSLYDYICVSHISDLNDKEMEKNYDHLGELYDRLKTMKD